MKTSSARVTRKKFLADCIGRVLRLCVAIAESAGSDAAVNRLLRAKDELNRRCVQCARPI
jgi:hypothetical protein